MRLLGYQRPPQAQPLAHLYGQPLVLLGEDIDELLPVDQPDPPEAFLFGFLAGPLRPEVTADLAEEVCKLRLPLRRVGLLWRSDPLQV
jgi:hypothetical protein